MRDLISNQETVLLTSFHQLDPNAWHQITRCMVQAAELGVETLMLGKGSGDMIGSALFGAGDRSATHGRLFFFGRRALFVPNTDLARILGLEQDNHLRNAVTLVHRGRVHSQWIAPKNDPNRPHGWAPIITSLHSILLEQDLEELELD